MLTIAIPTYNRNDLLKDCVFRLLPQINEQIKIVIIDNFSDIPAKDVILKCVEDKYKNNIIFIRNSVNIGGAANLLRCLELCKTKWLYCLGDDDLVADNCIDLIYKEIDQNPDSLYINFCRVLYPRPQNIKTEGLTEFIDYLKDWSSFLFMSSSVINADVLKKEIRWGYLYNYSWAPFQSILLKILNKGGAVIFSADVICLEESRSDVGWVSFPVVAAKMILPELIEDKALRILFARVLSFQTPMLSLLYWARITATNDNELYNFKMYVELYMNRCGFYFGPFRVLPYKMLAYFVLNPTFMPFGMFKFLSYIGFLLIGRSAPKARAMNFDRT